MFSMTQCGVLLLIGLITSSCGQDTTPSPSLTGERGIIATVCDLYHQYYDRDKCELRHIPSIPGVEEVQGTTEDGYTTPDAATLNFVNTNSFMQSVDVDFRMKSIYMYDKEESKIAIGTGYNIDLNQNHMEIQDMHVAVSKADIHVAVDWHSHVVYWADPVFRWIVAAPGQIEKVEKDYYKVIARKHLDTPTGIAVDPFEGLLCWSEIGANPKIECSDLMGRQLNRLTKVDVKLKQPAALQTDRSSRRIYWVDLATDTILSVTYEGQDVKTVLRTSRTAFYEMSIFRDILFVSDTYDGYLYVLNKTNGAAVANTLNMDPYYTYGITVYGEEAQPVTEIDYCAEKNCDHFCITEKSGATCVCSEGFEWDALSNKCKEYAAGYHKAIAFANATHICLVDIRAFSSLHFTPKCVFTVIKSRQVTSSPALKRRRRQVSPSTTSSPSTAKPATTTTTPKPPSTAAPQPSTTMKPVTTKPPTTKPPTMKPTTKSTTTPAPTTTTTPAPTTPLVPPGDYITRFDMDMESRIFFFATADNSIYKRPIDLMIDDDAKELLVKASANITGIAYDAENPNYLFWCQSDGHVWVMDTVGRSSSRITMDNNEIDNVRDIIVLLNKRRLAVLAGSYRDMSIQTMTMEGQDYNSVVSGKSEINAFTYDFEKELFYYVSGSSLYRASLDGKDSGVEFYGVDSSTFLLLKYQLVAAELNEHLEKLSEVLMIPWIMNKDMTILKDIIESLIERVRKYHLFLTGMKERSSINNKSPEPVRGFHDNWILTTVEASSSVIKNQYKAIDRALKESDDYMMIDLINFEPSDKEERRKWLQHLEVSVSVNIYTYRYGNNLGNVNIIYKIPKEGRRPSENIRIANLVRDDIMTFSTRRMRRDFVDKYTKKFKLQPCVLRNMYQFLTNFECTPNDIKEAEVDTRLMNYIMETEDFELLYDLRKDNGRPFDVKYEPFWDALQGLLDNESAVHERRQSNVQYLPFAMSVEDLRDQVIEKLPTGTPVPSISWIRLNFQPQNPYQKSAVNYTGKFNVKYAVQQRLLRIHHVDSKYCRQQFHLLKIFAVKFKDFCLFQSLDDKSIVPVGEPDHPVSTGVRSHHGGIVANDGKIVALDHDFHLAGIVPSVCFIINIPETINDSFYRGMVHVTVKDKVFQASSPLRHSVETLKLIRSKYSTNEVDAEKPILCRYTDGGPDHRTTYRSVQLCSLLEFVALDLDMFVAVRTAPSQSYTNPAERVMSALNLGLQNVSLERSKMNAEFEMQSKPLNSLKAIRNAATRNPSLKQAYVSSMEYPLSLIKGRFQKLKWTGERMNVHEAAAADEITELSSLIHVIDPAVNLEDSKTWKSAELQTFLDNHERKRHYMYQNYLAWVYQNETHAHVVKTRDLLSSENIENGNFDNSSIVDMRLLDATLQSPDHISPCAKNNGNCSQLCITRYENSQMTPVCRCRLGYTLTNRTNCTTAVVGDFFLLVTDWTDEEILQIDIATDEIHIVPGDESAEYMGVYFDPKAKKVIFAEYFGSEIYAVNLNGTEKKVLADLGYAGYAYRFDMDVSSGYLYFTAYYSTFIGVLTPFGEYVTLKDDFDWDSVGDIVVHPGKGWMYYTVTGWLSVAYIGRANMDGSNPEQLISGPHVDYPDGLAIDYINDRLFWSDATYDTIQQCNLDGLDCVAIVNRSEEIKRTKQLEEIRDLETDGEYLYYCTYKKDYLVRVELVPPYRTKIVGQNYGLGRLDSMALYNSQSKNIQPASSQCQARNGLGDCSTICLPIHNGRTCACEYGVDLKEDGRTCSNIYQCTNVMYQNVSLSSGGADTIAVEMDRNCLRTVDDKCKYKCPINFQPNFDTLLTCTKVGWNLEPNTLCREIRCPMTIANGLLANTCKREIGEKCDFECKAGFVKTRERAVCTKNGTFHLPDSELCAPYKCSDKIDNGMLDKSCDRRIGSSCKFTCNKYYTPSIATSEAACKTTGWSPSQTDLCRESVCDTSSLANGKFTSDCQKKIGDGCTFLCNQGYVKTTELAFCRSDKLWHPADSCIPYTCNKTIENGVLDQSCARTVGTTCRYTCNKYYTPSVNPVQARCAPDGWSPASADLCEFVKCPTTIPNGAITGTCDYTIGTTCSFECNSGYTPSGLHPNVTCKYNGVWFTDKLCLVPPPKKFELSDPGVGVGFGILGVIVIVLIVVIVCMIRRNRSSYDTFDDRGVSLENPAYGRRKSSEIKDDGHFSSLRDESVTTFTNDAAIVGDSNK